FAGPIEHPSRASGAERGMSLETNCPSCGAKIAFRSSASVVAVCEYCRSTLVRHDVDLQQVGKMADLKADGSPLQLGAGGAYAGMHFAVVGRIQYRFEQGLWNEWYLVFDDMRGGWLGEARGNYAMSFPIKVAEAFPPFAELRAGRALTIGGRPFEVVDDQRARTTTGEGERPFRDAALHLTSGAAAFVTDVFDMPGRTANVVVRTDADVSNSWIYLGFALISEETGNAFDFGREVSYYFGRDSDGAWSEGKRSDEAT